MRGCSWRDPLTLTRKTSIPPRPTSPFLAPHEQDPGHGRRRLSPSDHTRWTCCWPGARRCAFCTTRSPGFIPGDGLTGWTAGPISFGATSRRPRTCALRSTVSTGFFTWPLTRTYQPDFHRFLRVNAESAALLFELVVRDHLPVAKIVLASSQSVAGEGAYHCSEHGLVLPGPRPLSRLDASLWDVVCPTCAAPMSPELIDESVCRPHTAYAISKHAAEQLCAALGDRYGIRTACMRYTYVQGPRNSPFNAYSGIARRFALALLGGRPPVCYEDGQQLRDFVNVGDVARANVTVLDDERAVGIFNVGGGRAVTVLDFARLIAGLCESPLSPVVPDGTGSETLGTQSLISAGWRPWAGGRRCRSRRVCASTCRGCVSRPWPGTGWARPMLLWPQPAWYATRVVDDGPGASGSDAEAGRATRWRLRLATATAHRHDAQVHAARGRTANHGARCAAPRLVWVVDLLVNLHHRPGVIPAHFGTGKPWGCG